MPPPKADMHITVTNQPSLLDLKSVEIAEQMTLLDADLFQKIEIPEVLLFAKEQSEERSPNLNKFTEHFNNMSFWARSKILTLNYDVFFLNSCVCWYLYFLMLHIYFYSKFSMKM